MTRTLTTISPKYLTHQFPIMMQFFLKSIAIRLRLSRYPRGQSHTEFIDPFFQTVLESICVFSLEALKSRFMDSNFKI